MTPPGSAGTASDGYRTGPAPHTCPAGPTEPGIAACPCHGTPRRPRHTATSLRPVDSGGRRRGTATPPERDDGMPDDWIDADWTYYS